jgi:hypothetical protein
VYAEATMAPKGRFAPTGPFPAQAATVVTI